MANAFDAITGVSGPTEIGNVEMVGDRAMLVADVDKPAKYLEGHYTIQDRIDLGSPQNPTNLAAGAIQQFNFVCSSPFKPEQFIIDSTVATDISVLAIDIGSSRYIEGGSVPGAMYSEVSTLRYVSWRTVQTTVPIQITVRNDTLLTVTVKMAIRGLRLV